MKTTTADIIRQPNLESPLIFLLVLLATVWSLSAAEFTYTNPGSISVRDCQIVREGGTYYLTGTFPPFFAKEQNPNPGSRISSSTDLIHWTEPQMMVPRDENRWYAYRSWAPEIFPYQGRYYMTINSAAKMKNGKVGPQMIGVAVANAITGPYTVITQDQPLKPGNDASFFLDTDGKLYVFSSGIEESEVKLTPTNAVTVGAAISCISPGGTNDWDGAAIEGPNVGLEGPSVFKRNGIYYLMYSSWRRGYEIGYATAPTVRGPWTKYAGNPIYGAQDPGWCKKFHATYTQDAKIPFGQVGHGSPFFGPDGRIWFCCHGILQKGKGENSDPHIVITPMEFRPDGSIHMDLTWTPQTVPVPAPKKDPLWQENGTPAATSGAVK